MPKSAYIYMVFALQCRKLELTTFSAFGTAYERFTSRSLHTHTPLSSLWNGNVFLLNFIFPCHFNARHTQKRREMQRRYNDANQLERENRSFGRFGSLPFYCIAWHCNALARAEYSHLSSCDSQFEQTAIFHTNPNVALRLRTISDFEITIGF